MDPEEYCLGPDVISFGAISSQGLTPKISLIFLDDRLEIECKKANKEKNYNG